MHVEKITYTDYNGDEKTKEYRFNLSPAELLELELDQNGTLEEYIQGIVDAKESKAIKDFFKKILLLSYGEKSLDGERFEKSDTIRNNFVATPAYSILFTKLATNTDAAVAFVNNIIPSEAEMEALRKQINP